MSARIPDHELKLRTAYRKEHNDSEVGFVPPPRIRRKRSYEESDNQISFFKWWRSHYADFNVPECAVFSIPNGSALGTGREDWQVLQRIIRGKRLVAEGLTNGVHDIFVSVPATNQRTMQRYHGCYIEMKKKGGTMSAAQVAFKAAMESLGYKTAVCYSDQEAINVTTTYLTA